jgi:hypothetical protein
MRTTIRPLMMLAPTAAIVCCFPPAAAEATHREPHDHGSHVHGAAELLIVEENASFAIELRSPAVNLLGFEGQPADARHYARIESTRQLLEQPEQLFRFTGADCRLEDRGLEISGLPDADPHEAQADAAHAGDKHEETQDQPGGGKPAASEGDHDHDHTDDHADHHTDDHAQQGDGAHTDIVARYRFNCRRSDTTGGMELPLMDRFSGIEVLSAQWIVGGRQGARKLTQGEQTLRFR